MSACLLLAGCAGPQSALDPAGAAARDIALLFEIMTAGAAVIWLATMGLALYAAFCRRQVSARRAHSLVVWGGAVVPTVVLGVLLAFGLRMMPSLRAPGDDLRIAVSGEQFWWRVGYHLPGGEDGIVAAANELRLPAGRRVQLVLDSPDVIHSLWIPNIAGKMDLIPGRTTRLTLEPDRPGLYRGACAEFCGPSHTFMALAVEVMEPAEFDEWLRRESGPAAATGGEGRELFLANGCGACHTVRGTAAAGGIGPDLTHVGSRHGIAAGVLDNTPHSLARFIADPAGVKPGVRMPGYGMLPRAEVEAMAEWLGSLK